MTGTRLSALAGIALALGCSGAPTGIQGRFVAVHNTLEALGIAQVGHLSEGSLGEGGTARFPLTLEAQCYTFVAFGGDGARDVDVAVYDGNNTRVAGDAHHDAQGVARYCPPQRGRYTVAVRMAAGAGSYLLSTWRGGGSTGAEAGEDGAGTCANPLPLTPGQTVSGDTTRGRHRQTGSCIEGGSAPEMVYSLTLERRQMVTVAVEQSGEDYDGAVYVRRACEDEESEVANGCNDDDPDVHHSRVATVLDPGTYFVFVDGYGDARGAYSMTVTTQDVPTPAEVCQNAPALTPNQPVTGQTGQELNVFEARCANGARGPDRVYRLEVPQESRLQLHQESDYDGVLYLRRACADPGTEVECNDDAEDVQHARINTVVPAGTYYVFTDGYTPQASGNFTLEADLAPVAGGSVAGDTCADAQALTPGTPVEGNTFQARDDVPSPCAAPSDGYDVVYRLDVAARSRVRLWLDYADIGEQATIALTRNCAQIAQSNLACQAAPIREARAIDQELAPGTYFVVVDSAAPRAFGRFRLNSRVEDLGALERACRAAPLLVPGRTVTGTTSGADRFQASCAGGARSAESLYRLRITRRSAVRLALTSTAPNFDAALYIRQNCTDARSERACNDDAGDNRHSLIETTLEPGLYTVFVDGFGANNAGAYSLEVQVRPQ